MRIFIDADGCPVVDITVRTAVRYGAECTIICDTAHSIQREGAKTIVVDKGADSADFRLVNLVGAGDIAITQDYGLAAMCLAKKCICVSQDGLIYDESNIDSLLLSRHIAKKIRNSGGKLKGPHKRTVQADEKFRSVLLTIIKKQKEGLK